MPGERDVLEATANAGFLQPTTVAAVLGLEERLLIELVDRLGGEVHLPALAERMAEPPTATIGGVEYEVGLDAELQPDGTYVLRRLPIER